MNLKIKDILLNCLNIIGYVFVVVSTFSLIKSYFLGKDFISNGVDTHLIKFEAVKINIVLYLPLIIIGILFITISKKIKK